MRLLGRALLGALAGLLVYRLLLGAVAGPTIGYPSPAAEKALTGSPKGMKTELTSTGP
jgi:hypothetical protein